jgi:CO/xanthine dehydrogenase Mo-binding subunit
MPRFGQAQPRAYACIRTAVAVARKLAIPPESVVVVVGDTRVAPQRCTAGSWGTASAVPAATDAAEAILRALAQLAPGRSSNQTPAQILKSVGRPSLEVEVRRKADVIGEDGPADRGKACCQALINRVGLPGCEARRIAANIAKLPGLLAAARTGSGTAAKGETTER